MAPAYIDKKGATPHPELQKHSLRYDARPNRRIGVLDGAWKIGSLSGNGGEVCEELKRIIDMCCLQEVRWIGRGARMPGIKRKWWYGKRDGVGGLGVMVKEELCEKVVKVRMVSDRAMAVLVVFEDDVLRLVCAHAQPSGRC